MTEAAFHQALLDASQPVPDGLTDGAGRVAGRRYAVYRNNIAVSLSEALETAFPTVRALIGADNFAAVSARFLRTNPPDSPRMMLYGAGFDSFLASIEPLAHMGYLPDIARLDHAMRLSYHAADAVPAMPEALAALGAAAEEAKLILAPAVRLIPSRWPIHAIRAYALGQTRDKPPATPQDVIVLRPGYDPHAHVLTEGALAFVQSLQAGMTLGAAMDAVPDGFDPSQTLALLFQGEAISDIKGAPECTD